VYVNAIYCTMVFVDTLVLGARWEAHRGRVMRKMRVDYLSELVQVAAAEDVRVVAQAWYQSSDQYHRAIDGAR
jgi:hypothetical protein